MTIPFRTMDYLVILIFTLFVAGILFFVRAKLRNKFTNPEAHFSKISVSIFAITGSILFVISTLHFIYIIRQLATYQIAFFRPIHEMTAVPILLIDVAIFIIGLALILIADFYSRFGKGKAST